MSISWSTKIRQRDNWTCQECGITADEIGKSNLHAHHIKPKSQGGGDILENGITVCHSCHWSVYHPDGTYYLSEGFEGIGKKKLSFLVTDEMKAAIQLLAREQGNNPGGIVKMALNSFINKYQSENKAQN